MRECDYGNGNRFELKFKPGMISDFMSAGLKTATTRLEKKCEIGDWFVFDNNAYVVTGIYETTVMFACAKYYAQEGYISASSMRDDLQTIYPDLIVSEPTRGKGSGIRATVVYVHEYYKVSHRCYTEMMERGGE